MFDRESLGLIVKELTVTNKRRVREREVSGAAASATAASQTQGVRSIKPQSKKYAIFMCGPTASGKTSIKQIIAKQNKIDTFVNLDQDEVGRVLKEKYGEESRDVVRKTTLFHLLPNVIEDNKNVIVDRTCRDVKDTISSMYLAKKAGYYIIVVFVYIDKEEGRKRLLERNKKGRIVPVEVFENIYNDYENRLIKRYFVERQFPYNEIVLFNNSGTKAEPLFIKYNNKTKITRGKEEELFYGMPIKDIQKNLTHKKRTFKKGGSKSKKHKRIYKKKQTIKKHKSQKK